MEFNEFGYLYTNEIKGWPVCPTFGGADVPTLLSLGLNVNRKPCITLLFESKEMFMKVGASIKADPSKGDKIVRRQGRIYVINKKDPNRKQRQKGPARKK